MNMSLGLLIGMAYGVTPGQISPLDARISQKFDIEAISDRAATRDQMLRMLQTLLTNRFRLSIRHETRKVPAYALVAVRRQPGLHLSKEQLPWTLSRARGQEQASGRLIFENESMRDFASVLSTLVVVGRVVVDQTGLKGNYDFHLTFAPSDRVADPATAPPDAPSIFTAVQEQLGLKLEPRRAPVDFLVIEHVEKPSEN
jgi:uncharacterized protein (TIGR03435 family)